MADKRIQTPYDALTYQIIGAAMTVHRTLGPGYRENTYQCDLGVELARRNVAYEPQKRLAVYDGIAHEVLIGYYIPDFVVEGLVIVEIKALPNLDNTHVAQIIGYLAVTRCPVGLLINFGARSLEQKRILPPTKFLDHQVNRQWLYSPPSLRAAEE